MATKKTTMKSTTTPAEKPMLLRGFTAEEGEVLKALAEERGFRSRAEYLVAAIRHDAGMAK
jgi:hypothetical protein